jgi:hypothetical protein
MPCRDAVLPIIAALAALCVASAAHAQYQWRDEVGRMVYSDQPPPPSVPASAIVRQPRSAAAAAAAAALARPEAAPDAAPGAATAATPPRERPTAADAEMAYRKRRLEREQAERAGAEALARERRSAAACDEARSEARSMASGERVARFDERGERVFLDDAGRAERLEAARRAISELCRPG